MKILSKELSRNLNYVGREFGRLTVVALVPNRKKHERVWKCLCSCGNEHEVTTALLTSGKVRSCGCLQKEHWKTNGLVHGMTRTPIFNSFHLAKQRCNDKNHPKYKDYGGRGIRMEWKDFIEFKNDMYKSYVEHVAKYGEKNTTIERVDVNGNYCKENCRWATWLEQARNKRTTVKNVLRLREELGKV